MQTSVKLPARLRRAPTTFPPRNTYVYINIYCCSKDASFPSVLRASKTDSANVRQSRIRMLNWFPPTFFLVIRKSSKVRFDLNNILRVYNFKDYLTRFPSTTILVLSVMSCKTKGKKKEHRRPEMSSGKMKQRSR